MKIHKKIENSKKKQLVKKKHLSKKYLSNKYLSKKYLSKKHLSKKYLSKKHLSKKHLSKKKHKIVNKLSQYGSSPWPRSGWLKPKNSTSTNQISTINVSSQLIPFLETEMEKNKVVNGKYQVYIISIGCAPHEANPDLKQIYGDDIYYQDITNIEPHLIIIDSFDNKTVAAKTLEYINSPPILQVFPPENIVLFDMLLPTDGEDPLYSSLSSFVNQFNESNGCVIVRNFIRFRNIDYEPDAEDALDDEIRGHLIYKILYEKVFLQQSFTPNKLLLRWFGYTENENNILTDFQYCLFIETNNDEILTNSEDNDIRLLTFLQDRKQTNGSYRQDSINISPITHTDIITIKPLDNLEKLQKIESRIDKWKPIPFHQNITSSIQNVINKKLSTIQDYYQDVSRLRNTPISSFIRNKIQNVPTTINLPQIMITSNGLLSILER